MLMKKWGLHKHDSDRKKWSNYIDYSFFVIYQIHALNVLILMGSDIFIDVFKYAR